MTIHLVIMIEHLHMTDERQTVRRMDTALVLRLVSVKAIFSEGFTETMGTEIYFQWIALRTKLK